MMNDYRFDLAHPPPKPAGAVRVLWASRHAPLVSQVAELERLFPRLDLLHDARPFENGESLLRRFRATHADEMVVVAPLSIIRHICETGLKPLWAQMENLQRGDPRVEIEQPRPMRFLEFRRVLGLEIRFGPVHGGNDDA